jgi:hypothetical protein
MIAVQNSVTPGLMNTPAVLGTAVGVDERNHAVLVVYVDREHASAASTIRSLPVEIRGTLVRVETTEKFRAMAGKPGGSGGGGVSHTAKQSLPIQLGTSGGWAKDRTANYCCGGTLGSLVQVTLTDPQTNATRVDKYVLSNYHVFEADIVAGVNGVATEGDPVIQPGLIDVGCIAGNSQTVATLKIVNALQNTEPSLSNPYNPAVDCSVALVSQVQDPNKPTGTMMDAVSPLILEIGPISSAIVSASINQPVQKSGRTTGRTKSKVSGLNATIKVTYDNECAGGVAFTQTFVGQIVVANSGSKFLNSGDSGSLMVEDLSALANPPLPKAVGLLYAGSSTTAIANPIKHVLDFLTTKLGGPVTMVGQ